jgi:hypothetical protein
MEQPHLTAEWERAYLKEAWLLVLSRLSAGCRTARVNRVTSRLVGRVVRQDKSGDELSTCRLSFREVVLAGAASELAALERPGGDADRGGSRAPYASVLRTSPWFSLGRDRDGEVLLGQCQFAVALSTDRAIPRRSSSQCRRVIVQGGFVPLAFRQGEQSAAAAAAASVLKFSRLHRCQWEARP